MPPPTSITSLQIDELFGNISQDADVEIKIVQITEFGGMNLPLVLFYITSANRRILANTFSEKSNHVFNITRYVHFSEM